MSGYIREEPIDDPRVAVGMGYTEAKWVGERILEEARREVGLRSTVVRLSQLCGSSNGYWNEREWFPTVVKSAEYLHCLPDVNDVRHGVCLEPRHYSHIVFIGGHDFLDTF